MPIALINEATGHTVATADTDSNGAFSFTNLPDGTYAVLETQQPNGYNDGLDFPGSAGGVADPVPGDAIRHVVLAGGVNAINYEFGECPCPPAQLSGFVYEDFTRGESERVDEQRWHFRNERRASDRWRHRDPRKPGRQSGDRLQRQPGCPDGDRRERVLPVHQPALRTCSYMVVETQPAGLRRTARTPPGTTGGTVGPNQGIGTDFITDIPLGPGDNSQNNNFGELPPPTPQTSINGFVYLDVNRDCMKEAGEPGLPASACELTDINGNPVHDINGNLVGIVQTDANGFYQFLNLPVGDYRVIELPPQPIVPGPADPGRVQHGRDGERHHRRRRLDSDVITDINLAGGENSINNNFGEVLPSNVGGDHLERPRLLRRQQDRVFDAGDTPIGGARVASVPNRPAGGPTEVAQTTTNEQGPIPLRDRHAGHLLVTLDNVAGLIKEVRQGRDGERRTARHGADDRRPRRHRPGRRR